MSWRKLKINRISKTIGHKIRKIVLNEEGDPEKIAEKMADRMTKEMAEKMGKRLTEKISKKYIDENVDEVAPRNKGRKKEKVIYDEYSEDKGYLGFYMYAVAVVVLVLLLGGLSGFLWHESNNNSVNHDLIAEIDRLKGESKFLTSGSPMTAAPIDEMKGSAEEKKPTPTPTVQPEPMPEAEVVKDNSVKFNTCGHATTFWREGWYGKLKELAEGMEIDMSNSPSACYSERSGLFVFILPNEQCQEVNVYKFDVTNESLVKSDTSENSMCLGKVEYFGKRDGSVLKLKGYGEKDGCEWTDYFEYNFLENSLDLKKRSSDCWGEEIF